MLLYLKKEKLKINIKKLNRSLIKAHIDWVEKLNLSGIPASTGYLIDKNNLPGGGGILLFNANNYQEAEQIIKEDPIILSGEVEWELYEWTLLAGNLINK
tara:strand:- start:58 stop:357 length:300 start_codon:yes stop_codon:yes gene_type:complete